MHDSLVGTPIRLTYTDYCALPDDGRRYEILDGDLYMSPAPIPLHQRILFNLASELRDHVSTLKLGEVFISPIDVLLSKHDIVQPDIVFVAKARSAILTSRNLQGAPDLHVEVLSPSNSERDIHDKRNVYGRCGVDWYWIVDPVAGTLVELKRTEQTFAEVATFSRAMTFTPTLFPGLSIVMDELWQY